MSVTAVPSSPKRTLLEVQSEFNNLAFKAGHLQRDIYLKEKELSMINGTLDNLYVEYSTLKQQEDAAPAAQPEEQKKESSNA